MEKSEFLKGINNDTDHRVLLWEAMKLTHGSVVEFGSGHGSTPFLRQHCEDTDRLFESYENNPEWAKATGADLISAWENLFVAPDVLFIDHAPGERRKFDIEKYKDIAKIIVVHDTELGQADAGYQVRRLFPQFKYCVEVKTDGAWASMLSNYIDLSGCVGVVSKQYLITKYNG